MNFTPHSEPQTDTGSFSARPLFRWEINGKIRPFHRFASSLHKKRFISNNVESIEIKILLNAGPQSETPSKLE